RVAHARAIVDRVGPDHRARELLHQIVLFVGAARRADQRDRLGAVLIANRSQPRGDQIERLVPAGLAELTGFPVLDQRRAQAIVGVGELVGEAALDAGVANVGRALLARRDVDDPLVLDVDIERAADATIRAGRG